MLHKSSKASLPHLGNTSSAARWHLASTAELPE